MGKNILDLTYWSDCTSQYTMESTKANMLHLRSSIQPFPKDLYQVLETLK